MTDTTTPTDLADEVNAVGEMLDTLAATRDVLDSRDVIAVADRAREILAAAPGPIEEVVAFLRDVDAAADNVADWAFGETLIHPSYWVEYARTLAEDIGAVPSDGSWPCSYINWDAAADALSVDYTTVRLLGVDWYAR